MFFNGPDLDQEEAPELDAPEKTGPARFWQIIQSEFASLLKLNLLFLLTCIPVVTIPPALFALHQVVRDMVLEQSGPCARSYFAGFKSGWKRGYAAFCLTFLPMGLAGYGAFFYMARAAQSLFLILPFAFCTVVFLVAMLSSSYLYGLLCSGMSLRQAVRPALMLGMARPLRALLGALCYYGLPLLAVLFFPLSGGYLLLIGFSLPFLLGSFYTRTVLKQYCGV